MRKIGRDRRTSPTAPPLPLILYVEDNEDNWKVAELRLHKNYRLLRAANDREACTLFQAHAGEIYVVLMDIELQGSRLDGLELARLLRGRLRAKLVPSYAKNVERSDVPIIFVTAYFKELTPELHDAGGTLVIPKPVKFMDLMRSLTDLHLQSIHPEIL